MFRAKADQYDLECCFDKEKEYHQHLGEKKKNWENTTISESVRDVQKENNGGICIFKLEKGKYYGPHRIIYPPLSLPEH